MSAGAPSLIPKSWPHILDDISFESSFSLHGPPSSSRFGRSKTSQCRSQQIYNAIESEVEVVEAEGDQSCLGTSAATSPSAGSTIKRCVLGCRLWAPRKAAVDAEECDDLPCRPGCSSMTMAYLLFRDPTINPSSESLSTPSTRRTTQPAPDRLLLQSSQARKRSNVYWDTPGVSGVFCAFTWRSVVRRTDVGLRCTSCRLPACWFPSTGMEPWMSRRWMTRSLHTPLVMGLKSSGTFCYFDPQLIPTCV